MSLETDFINDFSQGITNPAALSLIQTYYQKMALHIVNNQTSGDAYDGDPSIINQSPSYRFVTDSEKTDWNQKLDSPTGTPDGTKYLRDDNTWQPVSGSGLTQQQIEGII